MLTGATVENERVIILCHVLLHPPQSPGGFENLLWNYGEVMDLLHSAEARCVVACLHGHTHTGSLFRDATGIYHIAFETPMYAEAHKKRYHGPWVVLEAYEDHLTLRGHGNVGSPVFGDGLLDDSGRLVVMLPFNPHALTDDVLHRQD